MITKLDCNPLSCARCGKIWHSGGEHHLCKNCQSRTDELLKETIRTALDSLSTEDFMYWIRGFVS